jgi:hypothetical protein
MIKKIAIGAAIVAGVVGIGTAAMATSGSLGTTAGSGTAASAVSGAASARHPGLRALAGRGVHGQVVTKDKDGSGFVTHDFVRGDVTAVSPTSISVKAADGVTEQFVVNSSTKVRVRTNGKGAAGAIGDVKTGDKVLVVGTGATTFTATHVVVSG